MIGDRCVCEGGGVRSTGVSDNKGLSRRWSFDLASQYVILVATGVIFLDTDLYHYIPLLLLCVCVFFFCFFVWLG